MTSNCSRLGKILATLAFVCCAGCGNATPTQSQEKLCIHPEGWHRLMSAMKSFGDAHHLEFHGEIQALSQLDVPVHLNDVMNFALIEGLHQLGGDNLDIWLVSNPRSPEDVSLNVISKRPLTAQQKDTLEEFKTFIQRFECEKT